MFGGGREFSIIVANSPSILDSVDAMRFLEPMTFSRLEKTDFSSDNMDIYHSYYHSREPLSPSHLENEDIQEIVNGVLTYKYNFYISILKINELRNLCIMAAPFKAMARDIFDCFKKNSKGQNVKYVKLDISKLVKTLAYANVTYDGDILVTKLEFEIEGDSLTKTVTLGGTDVPNSHTYTCLIESLNDLILRYSKVRISVSLSAGSGKSILEFDRFGNFTVPLHAKGKNLKLFDGLFKYFFKEHIAIETPEFPLFQLSRLAYK